MLHGNNTDVTPSHSLCDRLIYAVDVWEEGMVVQFRLKKKVGEPFAGEDIFCIEMSVALWLGYTHFRKLRPYGRVTFILQWSFH